MRLKALQVLEDGPNGRVQVTLTDGLGNQATYLYAGVVWSRVQSTSAGYLSVELTLSKPHIVQQNSASSRFTA